MSAADIPPEFRQALRAQLFNEWVHTLPSVMEQAALSAEQLAQREARASLLRDQMDALRTEGPAQ